MTLAKKTYQTRLAELLMKAAPDLKELILIQRDLQLTLIEKRSVQYYYLLENDASRLVRTEGVSHWSNFDWSHQDEQNLLRTDEQYASLTQRLEQLKRINQGHPKWPRLREVSQSVIDTEEYTRILKELTSALDETGAGRNR